MGPLKVGFTLSFLILLLVQAICPAIAISIIHRRQLFVSLVVGGGVGIVGEVEISHAACLPGDLSPNCIGVYKIPIDDFVGTTEEALRKYAPDVKIVTLITSPSSLAAAIESLKAQRQAANDIADVVAAGRLEEAGIKVLNFIPRLTTSGRVVLKAAEGGTSNPAELSALPVAQELWLQKFTNLLETSEFAWKEVDLMIGQGIRGDLGVSAVAQLLILSEIRQATAAFDNFLFVIDKLISR